MNRCMFDFGPTCTILTAKKCKGCKFRKTEKEFEEAQAESDHILANKNLEAVVIGKGYNSIMSVRKIKKDEVEDDA